MDGHTRAQQALLSAVAAGPTAPAMLVGRTTLTVTKATVLAALQKYLDETFKSAHVVVDVATAPNCYDASAFTISLDDGAEAARQVATVSEDCARAV